MRTAASERLADLIATAARMQLLLDGEGPQLLPGLLVARCAVAADAAASRLERLLALLEHAAGLGN